MPHQNPLKRSLELSRQHASRATSFVFVKELNMNRVASLSAPCVLIILLSVSAIADQTLLLRQSVCNNIQGALLSAGWGPNSNSCQWPNSGGMASNSQSAPWSCLSERCMNNCGGSCQACDSKICAASSITTNSTCTQTTSLLWIVSTYTGGGGGGCGGHPC